MYIRTTTWGCITTRGVTLTDGLIEEQEHVRLMNEEGEKLKSELKQQDSRKAVTWHMARSLMVVWHG